MLSQSRVMTVSRCIGPGSMPSQLVSTQERQENAYILITGNQIMCVWLYIRAATPRSTSFRGHNRMTPLWEVGRGAYHRTHDGEIIETIILYPRFPKDSLNQSIQWCHSSSLCCLTDLLSFLPGQSLQQNGMYNLPTWEWRRSAAASPLSCTLGSQTAKGIESSMKLQIHFFKQMINCQLARFITFLTWQS